MQTVLLVDDEPNIRWTMAEFLRREGYTTVTASDFDRAIEIAGSTRVDVAVVDIILPGKSGIDLLKELRQHEPYIPVIMITGEPNLSQIPEIVRAGAYDFISKPVIKDVLVTSVSRAVEKKRLIDEKRRLEQEIKEHAELLETRVAERTAELRQREEAMRATTSRLAALIENLQAGVMFADVSGRIALVNHKFCEFFAISDPARLVGSDCRTAAEDYKHLFEQPDLFLTGIAVTAGEQKISTNEELALADGRMWSRDYVPVFVEGVFSGHICVYNDITTRKKAEQNLRRMEAQFAHNEKIAALGRVAAQVAHEVKNPLAGLLLYTLHLKSKVRDKVSGGELELIDKILDTINHLTSTAEQILDLARPINLTRCRVDLNRLLSEVLQLIQPQIRANKIEIQLTVDESGATGMLDEASIRSALLNLLLNAIQAMAKGGKLTVVTGRAHGLLHLTISDTGRGMTEEELAKIFEPFYTTKRQGLGLGMPYAKKAFEQHGGTISVESHRGEGTRIKINLPAED